MEEALDLLDNYKVVSGGTHQMTTQDISGVDFLQNKNGKSIIQSLRITPSKIKVSNNNF